jgi:uncharacterized repeat protein (TIGR03803 family)
LGFKNGNVTKALQHRSSVSEIRQWVVNALALAIILITAILATPSAQAQTYTVLYSFTGGADGANPSAQLILDPSSNLYGTTGFGGYLACVQGHGSGCGVVFKLDGSEKETVLFTFTLGGHGLFPGGVIRDKAGNIYGTAGEGGGKNFGVVFKLLTDGQESVLHSFKDSTIDGANPVTGICFVTRLEMSMAPHASQARAEGARFLRFMIPTRQPSTISPEWETEDVPAV